MGLRSASLAAFAALLALGLLVASPFFNRGLVGTGEAFNYSLSVADAVTQMREGVVPPLAGQSQYAFNGRIHPLRNAPYLHYLCAGIDVLTLRKLSFWQLQNASLIFSLLVAVFGCYGGLRWSTQCPRLFAFFLTAVYALAPPLLGATYTFDLYMTVHAAAFVPLALAACVRGCWKPSFSADAWLAAALAAIWLAHPPVACWTTVCVILVRLVVFVLRPSWRVLGSGLCALVLGAFLSIFVFISVSTLNADLGYFASNPAMWSGFADVILTGLRGAFPGCLLPVSRSAGLLSDLQFGYAAFGLVALSLMLSVRTKPSAHEDRPLCLASTACAVLALLLVVVDLPVPLLTHGFWKQVPSAVLTLTTQWPMQRLYLVAVGLAVFSAGAIVPRRYSTLHAPRWAAPFALFVASAWVFYQATPFVRRGFADRSKEATTQAAYRPSNLDLTLTSYAFIGPSPTFVHGVMDPLFEFRILRNGLDDICSPLTSALETSPVVQSGVLRLANGLAPGKTVVSQRLTLLPNHRYLLTFAFRTPPVKALLYLKGPLLDRTYILPEAGQAKGFGMMGGQRRSIPLWTDSPVPEQVEIRVWLTDQAVIEGKPTVFADFTLQDVAVEKLPIRLESLLPLRFAVDAPQAGCTVEVPRRYIPGYEATVNGKPSLALLSPYRQVMIPVPAGHSVVVLSYPGPNAARLAFWICLSFWMAFGLWRATGSWLPLRPWAVLFVPIRLVAAHRWSSLLLALIALLAAAHFRARNLAAASEAAVGPVRVDFRLPYGQANVNRPILATGRRGAGVVIYAHFIDERHISLGADVWGSLFESHPIEVDYSQVQTLIVSDGALFPLENPRVRALPAEQAAALRSRLRVELNGSVEIDVAADCFESKPEEILAGHTNFGSTTEADLLGPVLNVERLPIPQVLVLPASRHAQAIVKFPRDRDGRAEPLLSLTAGKETCTCEVGYLAPGKIKLTLVRNGAKLEESPVVTLDPGRTHALEIWPTGDSKDGSSLAMSCTFDGKEVLGSPSARLIGQVPVLRSGLDLQKIPGLQARFTGSELQLSLRANSTLQPIAREWGPAEMVISLPSGKSGRHEPLLTSGVTGAGDFAYIIYEDARHIRLGFDHWNGPGALSDPIEVDYSVPHEIWISSGPLFPDLPGNPAWESTPPAELARLRTRVQVALDGKVVISASIAAYPCPAAQITFLENRIGGSTADATFSGTAHFIRRIGVPPAFH